VAYVFLLTIINLKMDQLEGIKMNIKKILTTFNYQKLNKPLAEACSGG